MPRITEIYWVLWYGAVYAVAIAGAWFVITLLVLAARRGRKHQSAPVRRDLPELENDPELHRFFARVNHAYRRRPPAHVEAPLPGTAPLSRPRLIHEKGDPSIITQAVEPEAYNLTADPFVLHSAPFYSPREEQPTWPHTAPKIVSAQALSPRLTTTSHPVEPGPTEQTLAEFVNIWAQLSQKDRRELLAIARMKASIEK